MKCFFINLLLFYCAVAFGQTSIIKKTDFSAAQEYINVAMQIQSGDSSDLIKWSKLLTTPACQMMISVGAMDTTTFKSDMLKVYNPAYVENSSLQNESQLYHYQYKKILPELESYLRRLNSTDVVDSVKKLLYPFLPQRLQSIESFPKLFYLFLGHSDATGISGLVLNDLLLSYKIDSFKFGLLTSHEALHAIVSTSFEQRLAKTVNTNSPEFMLFYFIENISEEGIADLIDKPILGQKSSPIYETVNELRKNDTALSIMYIKRLDTLLSIRNASDSLLNKYNSFAELSSQFGGNGGHIPGRFMGLVINEGGTLNDQIQSIEDPTAFFINYNQAANKLEKKNYPLFSNASIVYLKKLKNKMTKD